jgi:hypothetical protein
MQTRDIQRIGHFKNYIQNQQVIDYGLFSGGDLIGVTVIYQWNLTWARFRTIHIKKEFRGNNLGASLLATAYKEHWPSKCLIGWMRKSIFSWAHKFGFEDIDNVVNDQHRLMILKEDRFKEYLEPHAIRFVRATK